MWGELQVLQLFPPAAVSYVDRENWREAIAMEAGPLSECIRVQGVGGTCQPLGGWGARGRINGRWSQNGHGRSDTDLRS